MRLRFVQRWAAQSPQGVSFAGRYPHIEHRPASRSARHGMCNVGHRRTSIFQVFSNQVLFEAPQFHLLVIFERDQTPKPLQFI